MGTRNNQPLSRVDVFVPCYRYGRFLDTCVRSILSQEGVDVRVLILDDASPDETEMVGRRLERADSRVEYRRHAANRGHIATYNEGIRWATGDYVQLLSPADRNRCCEVAHTRKLLTSPAASAAYARQATRPPPCERPRKPCESSQASRPNCSEN